MNFIDFTGKYWDVFNRHICKYHSLEIDFIRLYSYDLDWVSLSQNVNISWQEELFDEFQNLFEWNELARNTAIEWTPRLINKYKARLDWHSLASNKHLPVSESFLSEFKDIIYIIESNIYLNDELVRKFNLKLIPYHEDKEDIYTDELDTESFIFTMENNSSPSFYKRFMLPALKKKSINLLYSKALNYDNRFFKISPIKYDKYGLTPEYKQNGGNSFGFWGENKLLDIDKNLEYVNGTLVEGPARLYECIRFSGMSYYPILLISENIKKILECFTATGHQFVPIYLNDKKLVSNLQYYVLQMERDSLLQTLDFEELQFSINTKQNYFSEVYDKKLLDVGSIKSYQDYIKLRKEELPSGIKDRIISPTQYKCGKTFDIFTIEYDIVVSERVKEAIEKYLPNQVFFESMQKSNIIQSKQLEAKEIKHMGITIKPHGIKNKKDHQFYKDKMDRLILRELIEDLPPIKNDEFNSIQKELQVVIPEIFKRLYRKNILQDGFKFLEVSEFYNENRYLDKYPETYKSMIVAENGLGDSLGLLLQKKDDFKLGSKIYLFSHEDSSVEQID